MTFWEWLDEHKTGILGWAGGAVSTLTAMIAAGMFDGLLDDRLIKWLAIAGIFIGGGTIKAGASNRTKERVAESEVKVAEAMNAALMTTPPPTGDVR